MDARKRVKPYELLGMSQETKVTDPDIIRITDEANDILSLLCDLSNCGRGGIVDAAIRLLAESYSVNNELAVRLVNEAVNNRSFIEIARDRLEKA